MLGTYASFALIAIAATCVGQAVFAVCGRREWSWLSPAIGLAAITAIAWGTIRLPGDGVAAAVAVGVAVAASLLILRGRVAGLGDAVRVGLPVLAAVLVAASLPFWIEGRFGILGTGLNPDMSQHLFAASRLADGEGSRLIAQGYPLGPHAVVVAVSSVTGDGLVHGFDGLALAIAACAALAPLAFLGELAAWRRVVGAVLVGLPYLVASYVIQGAFKETMEALFVLAFAIGLAEAARGRLIGAPPRRALVGVPLAVLAIGCVYAYSFPGVLWPAGAAALWAMVELWLAAQRDGPAAAGALARAAAPATLVALALLAIAAAPEVSRIVDFASFETFDPSGPGLGNLFNPISPLEALGIWPSGDFRLDPGDGAVPAFGYYLGELLGLAALAYGLAWWLRRSERAVPAAFCVAVGLFAYAHFTGTPYQAAKATVIASPLAMLIAVRALLSLQPIVPLDPIRGAIARTRVDATGHFLRHESWVGTALAIVFCAAATGCTILALVNGPVGPRAYSPALAELRPALGRGSTLVLAPRGFLEDEHGRDYLVWELRGGRVCVGLEGIRPDQPPPPGISRVISVDWPEPPFAGLRLVRRSGNFVLWARRPAPEGPGPCPLIAVGARANPAAD